MSMQIYIFNLCNQSRVDYLVDILKILNLFKFVKIMIGIEGDVTI